MAFQDKSSYLPECWDDDERMNIMFMPFRNKKVNPTAWQSKMDFWTNCVNKFCEFKNKVTFTQKDVEQAFLRKGKLPSCLSDVLSEMNRQNNVMTYAEYVSSLDNRSWMSWGYNLAVKRPLSWGWSTLKSSVIKTPDQASSTMVHISVLKSKSNSVLMKLKEQTKNIFNLEEVIEICKAMRLDSQSLELCLVYLEKHASVAMSTVEKGKYVKVLGGEKEGNNSITTEDIGIVRLKKAKGMMEDEIINLENLIERNLIEAKSYLKNGSRNMAKNCLKKKKMFESILTKKEMAIENLQVLINNIEEAESNRMVSEAYRAGVEAYKQKIKENGLNLDTLDDVMVSVQEVLDTHEDMMEAVSSPVNSGIDAESDELERELAEIIAEAKSSEKTTPEFTSKDLAYPEIPSDIETPPESDINDLWGRLQRLRSPVSSTRSKQLS